MSDAASHYRNLLARHYTWMHGPFDEKVARERALLERCGARGPGLAVDLGCGPGYQSLALAQLGYRVLAIDTSRELVAELESRRGDAPIETRAADLLEFAGLASEPPRLIACMGDTLPHLRSADDVRALFASVAASLAPGGLFILGFRDLSRELTGDARFILVRSDADRILTCFLEYEPDRVIVHDVVHERSGAGFEMHASSYPKLRLSEPAVAADLAAAGLRLRSRDSGAGQVILGAAH